MARSAIADTGVAYLPWDFEHRPLGELPAALAALGYDSTIPTLTLWEGVTVFLSEQAIDATVRTVRLLSAPGALFAFTYFDRATIAHARGKELQIARVVALAGEPFRFGWEPSELPAWLSERGFTLAWDCSIAEEARCRLPPEFATYSFDGRRIALARVDKGQT